MAARCRLLLLLAVLLTSAVRLSASTAEENAFKAAEKEFQDGFFKKAEEDFGDFADKFPASTRLPDAFLYQANARLKQGDFKGVLNLLSQHWAQAGKLGDQYVFLEAEALFQKGDFQAAADTFGKMVHDFPNSSMCLQAVIRRAGSLGRLSEWTQVIALLEQTNSVFQIAAAANADSELVSRGYAWLTEAQLGKGNLGAAEAILQVLSKRNLNAELDWQRQYLLCRLLLRKGDTEGALQNSTNLIALAITTTQRRLQAESVEFQASVLERLKRIDEAIATYQNNLGEGIPAAQQRDSLLKIVRLLLGQNRLSEAAQILEKFVAQYPKAEAGDLALLTLGELRLKQQEENSNTNSILGNPPTATNYLQQAQAAFANLSTNFPASPLFGKAQLDLGWCLWLEGRSIESELASQPQEIRLRRWPVVEQKIAQSQAAFQVAVGHLTNSIDLANAYFKLADDQLWQTNSSGAISNYNAIIEKFGSFPEVRTNLFEPALYQLVRASLVANDLSAASNALSKILTWYPSGFHTDRAVLIFGQQLGQRNPEMARKLFRDFVAAVPDAPLIPEVRLAIARTYEEEDQWTQAIEQYNQWLHSFAKHPSYPQALYYAALANFRAFQETNALALFTNLVAQFPTHELTPWAQSWVADYFMRSGRFEEAESQYQLCYQNTNSPSSLSYQAKMMAGRAALAHLAWKDATQYFTNLTSDAKCPSNIWFQAMFAYGDTLMSQDSTNRPVDLQTAVAVFTAISDKFPNSQEGALAWGAKAKALLQLAQTASEYEPVTNAFQQVINSPAADATARSIARVGIALTLEKIAEQNSEPEKTQLLEAALDNYLNVFYPEKLLREGESPDSFWTRKAGLDAARLLGDKLKRRAEAINVLRRLQQMFPPLRLADRIEALQSQEQDSAGKN
jgi:TolA-binding protein